METSDKNTSQIKQQSTRFAGKSNKMHDNGRFGEAQVAYGGVINGQKPRS